MHILRISLCLCLACCTTACSKKKSAAEAFNEKLAESMAEQALKNSGQQDVDVDFKGGQVNITTKEGTFKYAGGDDAAMPEGFPQDVPKYKGTRIAQSMSTPQGSSVTLMTSADRSAVVTFYKDTLTANGWTIDTTMQSPQYDMLTFK
ncbi:MAG: hypothetical protein O3A51_10055, partial [Verrucomicrobia bacterium]|nr:hypothetical protein [Verrucomicrobiota bacterium]